MTDLLKRWMGGDLDAGNRAFGAMYPELKAIAHRELARRRGGSLKTTELVHEAFLRLEGNRGIVWQGRSQLLGLCCLVIRRLLVDEARTEASQKRGGEIPRIELSEGGIAAPRGGPDVIALGDALERLERERPRPAAVVTMRYFGGMTVSEIADALGLSVSTIEGDWRLARAWLRRDLET